MIFNLSGLLPNITETFAQIHVLFESASVYFPSLTNQRLSLCRGTTVTSHSKACCVILVSIGETGGGGGDGSACTLVALWSHQALLQNGFANQSKRRVHLYVTSGLS